MARRIAVLLVAMALVASSAHAASAPASSKGRKTKGKSGGSSSSCPNAATCGLATAAQVAALELYNTINYAVFTSSITLDSSNPDNDCTTDFDDTNADWGVSCSQLTTIAPATTGVIVSCPPEGQASGDVSQFYCEAYVTDGQGSIINALPTFTTGTFGAQAVCSVDTSNLADGTTVTFITYARCSDYAVWTAGAKASAAAPLKLADMIKKN
jgi:hypothetical protein